MLIEFRVQNFLSFRDEATFSMLAAPSVREHDGSDDPSRSNLLLEPFGRDRVLKFAALYGANGSGKSNLIRSLLTMKNVVCYSLVVDGLLSALCSQHFCLDRECATRPSAWEIVFVETGVCYRYGFEVERGEVSAEWLFRKKKGTARESYCFERDRNTIKVNPRTWAGAKGVAEQTRKTALYLTTCAQFNVQDAITVKDWFAKKLVILSGTQAEHYLAQTIQLFRNDQRMNNDIVGFLRQIDSGIRDIKIKAEQIEDLSAVPPSQRASLQWNVTENGLEKYEIRSRHDCLEKDGSVSSIEMPFDVESTGTQKAFALAGPWFEVLRSGGTLVVDEFGSYLHTKLSLDLVKIFQRVTNTNAQLIVATHDTNLLRRDLLRRDQIWFAEKKDRGVTDLYSLVEYRIDQARAVRNDASYGKDYLLGRYGAIPYFGDVEQFLGGLANDGK